MTKNKFPATVIIVIIFAGAIFLLSGLCTGVFAWDAEMTGGSAYSPGHWYEALLVGSFALIPSGLMLWAALRQMRRGNNKVTGIIFLIFGGILSLFAALSLLGAVIDIADISSASLRGDFGYTLIGLNVNIVMLACGIWLIRIAVKILRDKDSKPIDPETFD